MSEVIQCDKCKAIVRPHQPLTTMECSFSHLPEAQARSFHLCAPCYKTFRNWLKEQPGGSTNE